MKSCCLRAFLIVAALLITGQLLHAEKKSGDWNIVEIDKILKAVPIGEKLALVGDMEILVTNLSEWRNQLAGTSTKLAFAGGGVATWPSGNLYYTFDANVTSAHRKEFLDGALEWATFANLHFIP